MAESSRQLLRSRGLRATHARVALLDLLERTSLPAAASEIAAGLEPLCDRPTVYRNLTMLSEAGLVEELGRAAGQTWFRPTTDATAFDSLVRVYELRPGLSSRKRSRRVQPLRSGWESFGRRSSSLVESVKTAVRGEVARDAHAAIGLAGVRVLRVVALRGLCRRTFGLQRGGAISDGTDTCETDSKSGARPTCTAALDRCCTDATVLVDVDANGTVSAVRIESGPEIFHDVVRRLRASRSDSPLRCGMGPPSRRRRGSSSTSRHRRTTSTRTQRSSRSSSTTIPTSRTPTRGRPSTKRHWSGAPGTTWPRPCRRFPASR